MAARLPPSPACTAGCENVQRRRRLRSARRSGVRVEAAGGGVFGARHTAWSAGPGGRAQYDTSELYAQKPVALPTFEQHTTFHRQPFRRGGDERRSGEPLAPCLAGVAVASRASPNRSRVVQGVPVLDYAVLDVGLAGHETHGQVVVQAAQRRRSPRRARSEFAGVVLRSPARAWRPAIPRRPRPTPAHRLDTAEGWHRCSQTRDNISYHALHE